MASKITLFETHFHDSQFGPASIETGHKEDDEGESSREDESESKSPVVMFLQGATVFLLLFVFLWIVLSRLLSEDDSE
jgi:hypothetical protein